MSEEIIIPAKTPEEIERERIAELDEASKQRETAESELAAKDAEIAKLSKEKSDNAFFDAVSTARVATGLKFYLNNRDLVKLLRSEPDLTIDESGSIFASGKRVTIEDALLSFAQRHPWSTERTPIKKDVDNRFGGITAKSQLIGVHAKTQFVSKYGAKAFEELPLHHTPAGDLTQLPPSQLRKLPTREKIKLIQRIGEKGWAELLEPSRETAKQTTWSALDQVTRGVR